MANASIATSAADQVTYPDTWESGDSLAKAYFLEHLRQESDLGR